jgi:D-glycero-alpha-D-manno-heptose 1-phosphate guanylyltransferase
MDREAVILAGGLGTRLKETIGGRPKPMALVNGKPFLAYLIRYLQKNNFQHLILAVGYKHTLIRDYFGTDFRGIPITYAVEETPLGTGGAVLNALKYARTPRCFILNGDTYFPVSPDRMEQLSDQRKCDLVLALYKLNNVSRYGTVTLNNENRITGFREKKESPKPGIINGGIYYLCKKAFMQLPFPKIFSFENDYLVPQVHHQNFCGIIFPDYFIDIGIPETLEQAQKDFFTFDME